MKRVVVVGGGTGGSVLINKLAAALRDEIKDEAVSITVVNPSDKHYYQPAFLLIPVGVMDEREAYKPFEDFVPEGVKWVRDKVVNLDLDERRIYLSSGSSLDYDYLVLSTGAQLDESGVDGLSDTYHFYSLEGAIKLKKALSDFEGGRIAIGISSIPYRCPPAPIEFTFLVHDFLVRRGIRDRTEITYFYPLPRVFTIEGVAEMLAEEMEKKGINTSLFFNLERVDVENKKLISMEGEELEYDLAIVVPPHKGADYAVKSGIADEDGWINVDKYTLNIPGYDDVYAIGDATNLPVSKAGSVADFQADVVAKRIVDDIEGFEPSARYNGKTMCFVLTGIGRATVLVFDYNNPPPIVPPSFVYYWLKLAYNKLYWSITAKSLLTGVVI